MAFADGPALGKAVALIERVCEIAAPRRYLSDLHASLDEAGIAAAVANHDTPALFGWLMDILSYQASPTGSPVVISTSMAGLPGRT